MHLGLHSLESWGWNRCLLWLFEYLRDGLSDALMDWVERLLTKRRYHGLHHYLWLDFLFRPFRFTISKFVQACHLLVEWAQKARLLKLLFHITLFGLWLWCGHELSANSLNLIISFTHHYLLSFLLCFLIVLLVILLFSLLVLSQYLHLRLSLNCFFPHLFLLFHLSHGSIQNALMRYPASLPVGYSVGHDRLTWIEKKNRNERQYLLFHDFRLIIFF